MNNLFEQAKASVTCTRIAEDFRLSGLKSHGSYHTALCPFHDDKQASFSIHDGYCKCFSNCGWNNGESKGDVISFVAALQRTQKPDAAKFILSQYGGGLTASNRTLALPTPPKLTSTYKLPTDAKIAEFERITASATARLWDLLDVSTYHQPNQRELLHPVWRYLLFDRLLTEQNIAMQKIGLHIMPLRDQENRWVNFSVLSFTWFTPDGTPIGIKYRFSDANWNNPRYHKTVIRSRYTQEAGGAIHGAVYIAPCVRNSPEDNAEIYRLPLLGAEGEFKAITFAQLGFDAFTCGAATGAPRTHIPSQWDVYFRGRSRAIYIHDNDDAGRTAAQQIVNIMPIPTKTISVPAPYKAFDDWLLVPPPPSQRGPHDAILWLESKVFPLI